MLTVASTTLQLLSLVMVLFGWGQCQYPLQACCDLKLMDATRQVAVETGRPLASGTYSALRIRLCTTDTVYIQLWTVLSDNNTVQLKWQTAYKATTDQNAPIFVTLNLNNPITVTANDRLGLYGVSSTSGWRKISIPYDLDLIYGSTRYTQTLYSDITGFTTGVQTTLDTTEWPRTFRSFVQFCTASNCTDLPPATSYQSASQTTPSTCSCPVTCTPDSSLRDSVNQQSISVHQLADMINDLSTQVESLSQSTIVTGYCPTGSKAGSYGVGSCYYIVREPQQFGEAAFRCAKLYNATLLQINSLIENDFLYGLLLNLSSNANVTNFWTSGLYSTAQSQWQWFTDDRTATKPISASSYTNWLYNSVPTPKQSSSNYCLALTINTVQQTTYWQNADCNNVYSYVCEVAKRCN